LSIEEKTNDYENFEKGMIYMKILKKRGGRRKRNPCTCGKYPFKCFNKFVVIYHFKYNRGQIVL
jgi:hypothetical protein